ncbi:hypothetical protein D3C75_1176860 [compost metagenome]
MFHLIVLFQCINGLMQHLMDMIDVFVAANAVIGTVDAKFAGIVGQRGDRRKGNDVIHAVVVPQTD